MELFGSHTIGTCGMLCKVWFDDWLNMMITNIRDKIANMSFVCACLVVSIHSDFTQLSFLNSWVKNGIARIAVPYFFLVSGFLLAKHFGEEGWYVRELKKRIKSILMPYVLWALIAALVGVPLAVLADQMAGRTLGASIPWLHGHALNILGLVWDERPLMAPLWYLRSLMIYVLFSKILKIVLDRWGWIVLVLCLLGNFLFVAFVSSDGRGFVGFLQKFISTVGLMYFTIGLYLARFDLTKFVLPRIVTLGLFVLGLSFIVFTPLRILSAPLLIIVLWQVTPIRAWPKILTRNAMSVYLLHILVTAYLVAAFKVIYITEGWQEIVTYVLSVVFSILIIEGMRHFFPRMTSVLLGGR